MANCELCGEVAGRRKTLHERCLDRRNAALELISGLVGKAARGDMELVDFEGEALAASADNYVRPDEVLALCVEGFETCVQRLLETRIITKVEEDKLSEYLGALGVPEWKVSGAVDLVAFCRGLLRMMDGADPRWVDGPVAELPLETGEELLYVFYDTRFLERGAWMENAGSESLSGSRAHGGLYIGLRDIRNRRMGWPEGSGIDGFLAVTSKRLRFGSPGRWISVAHAEISEMSPGINGLMFERHDAGVGAEAFVVSEDRVDGWRLYNLLLNLLNRREQERLRRSEAGAEGGK